MWESFKFLIISMLLAERFFNRYSLSNWGSSLLLLVYLELLSYISVGILSNIEYFFCIYWYNHVSFFSFFFCLLMWWIIINCLLECELALHTWNKSHLVMVYNSFYTLLDSIWEHFVDNFCTYVLERYWFVAFFTCNIFVSSWY